ncbi:hypothetical protein [Nocardioides speluncae]|uniref:hypothetical protein n=1 Tax=Nocardioides speluncae TaxID=2670337 RepID=UPI000D695649|nr:hypothetical protein [Nocardioides speluncae]
MAILRDHPITGTVGNTVADSFDTISGTPTYATGGIGGGLCAEITADVTEYMQDNLTAEYDAFYLRFEALPGSDSTVATVLVGATHTAALRVHSNGTVGIFSGLTTEVDTSSTVLSTGTWYRIERRTGTATQEVRIYTETGATPLETLTGATAVATLPSIYRWGHPHTGARAGTQKIDRVVLADDWPNLGTITGTGAPAAAAGTAAGSGTVALTGAGAATAPAGDADGAGTLTVTGAGTAAAAAGEASGSGTVGSTVTGSGAATAPAGQTAGAGAVSLTGTGAAAAPAADVDGSGSLAIAGAGAPSAPAAQADGDGAVTVTGTGQAVAPAGVAAGSSTPTLSDVTGGVARRRWQPGHLVRPFTTNGSTMHTSKRHVTISRGSLEEIEAADIVGDVNLTMGVEISVTDVVDGVPIYSWRPAEWVGAVGTKRTARTTLPVDFSAAALPGSLYQVHAKLTATPSVPILHVGTITIV